MIADKVLMISSILLAMTLVGAKNKANSRAQDETEEESSQGEGRATILYEYSDVKEGAWALSIKAEVPVTIKRDLNSPEKWGVRGSTQTTYYTQGQTENPDGSPCYLSCDFNLRIYFDGELINLPGEGPQFQVKNFFVSDIDEDKGYGNPPMNFKDSFGPASALTVYGALPERKWIFDQDNRAVTLPRPEGQTFKATIKDIRWPKDMREVSRWD